MQFAAKPYNRRGLSTEYDFKKREGYDGDTTSENRHGQVTFKVNKPKITTEKLSNSNEQRKLKRVSLPAEEFVCVNVRSLRHVGKVEQH